MAGIFILEGMTLAIPKFTLSMADDGSVSGDMSVELRYDACLAWCAIALDHRAQLKGRLADRKAAWSEGEDDPRRGPTLEAEFRSAMQAVVAAATSVDALYDIVRGHAQVSAETVAKWSKNRTARHKQVSETLRSAFKIRPDQAEAIQQHSAGHLQVEGCCGASLRSIASPGSASGPCRGHGVASRRVPSGVPDAIVCSVVGILWDLSRGTKYRSEGLGRYMGYCRTRLEALLPEGRPVPAKNTVNFYIPPKS